MNLQVVVMRAFEQAKPLMSALTDRNVTPILIPMLSIHPVILSQQDILHAYDLITKAHYVIITSANVIRHLPPMLIKALKDALIITMGESTSASLLPFGLSAILTAKSGSTSESLLEEGILTPGHIRDKSIVILTGRGGRTLMADALRNRGAHVDAIISYEATKPSHLNLNVQFEEWQQSQQAICFLITSQKILMHLLSFTPATALAWLHQQKLIVVSERIKIAAEQLGFQRIVVSRSANVNGLVEALSI